MATNSADLTMVNAVRGNAAKKLSCANKKAPKSEDLRAKEIGASGENRTPTLLPTADFESAASTNSATEAWRGIIEMLCRSVK